MAALVAILAAGESKRMGEPKLCLPWGQTTILGHVLAQWRAAGVENRLVVHGPGETPVTRELDRLGIPATERIATRAMERGMMGSIVTAAGRSLGDSSLTHLIIAPGDQPHLCIETLRELLRACKSETGKLIRVVHNDNAGHPIALPAHILAELSASSAETLRDFLRLKEMPVRDLTSPDSGVLIDLDTHEDYQRARRSDVDRD